MLMSHGGAEIVLGPGDPAGSLQSLPLEQPQSDHRESWVAWADDAIGLNGV